MAHPPLRSVRLLDPLRERIRYAHYSLRTEKIYVYWVRFFIRFHNVRHPRDMGAREVEAFLTFLANERKVAPSTHRQALAAILYLYKEVLSVQLPWMDEIGRPKQHVRIPVVLFSRRGCFGHSDVSTTMIYTHVLSSSAAGTPSPLEILPRPATL